MYDAFAAYYDRLTGNVDYRARARYFHKLIHKYLESNADATPILLDLGCGTGSLSVKLCDLGYDVIAVDASAGMLARASLKAGNREILFLRQAFSQLDLYGTVDVTVCALDCLNHITNKRRLKESIEKVGLFTAPGGLFLFDVNMPYKHKKILGNRTFVYDLKDLYCVWQNQTDDFLRTQITLDFFVQQQNVYIRETEQFCERVWPHGLLARLLTESGFELLHVYSGDTFSPVSKTAQRAVYVARKI